MSRSPLIPPNHSALSGLSFPPLPAPRAGPETLPSDPSTPLFERELSFSAARCSPAPSSCSHGSGSSHPPNSRSRKRRFSFVDGPSLENAVGEGNSRVNNWDDGQRSRESLAELRTLPGLSPHTLDTSKFSPRQIERMEKKREAASRFRARKRKEAQLEGQVVELQQENQRLRETIERQGDHIQRQKEHMEKQISVIFHLTCEKTHYHFERDFFQEELCRFIPLDRQSPRPLTPHEPSRVLPRLEDLQEDPLYNTISGNTNEPQRPSLETQSAHSAFRPFSPTHDSISTEKSESPIQSQSTRELSALRFRRSWSSPLQYDQRAYGYTDFGLNDTAKPPFYSPNPFLKLDNPSYIEVGQSIPAKRKHEAIHGTVHCDVPGCRHTTGFAGQHRLDLHKRVAHPNDHIRTVYRCFGKNCPRPSKAWPRLENLKQHIARMHADESFDALLEESMAWCARRSGNDHRERRSVSTTRPHQ